MPQITQYRAALRDPQFLSDVGATGQVSILSTDLIEHGRQTRFKTPADAAGTTHYVGDRPHPGTLGAEIRMTDGGGFMGSGVACQIQRMRYNIGQTGIAVAVMASKLCMHAF